MNADGGLSEYMPEHRLPRAAPSEPEPPEELDTGQPFGWFYGVRERADYLEVRLAAGGSIAAGFAWLKDVWWVPSAADENGAGGQLLILRFVDYDLVLRGRNLNKDHAVEGAGPNERQANLLRGLLRRRVPWVEVTGERHDRSPDGATVIYEAKVLKPGEEPVPTPAAGMLGTSR